MMNAVIEMRPLKRGDDQGAGVVRTLSGKLFDLANPDYDLLDIDDIAWSISKQIRYNGHIPYDYSVARHSVIMSYFVPPEYAMEALLHDAGEAYCGDVIYPLKRLYPELERFEDRITGLIMMKWNMGKQAMKVHGEKKYYYEKSDLVKHADALIAQHECYRFGRPGQYVPEIHEAERTAMKEVGLESLYTNGKHGDREAFLNRFYDLNPQPWAATA